MRKFDHDLTHVGHDILHWLDVAERVTFKLCMSVFRLQVSAWNGTDVSVRDVSADLVGCWTSSISRFSLFYL